MLGGAELALLLSVLRDSNGSLDSVAATFHRSFPKGDLFKIGATITILLQDALLTRSERIVAFYILFDLFRNSGTNPFLPVFLESLERDSTHACEKRFLKSLILSTQQTSRDAAKKSASDLIAEAELDLDQPFDIPDLDALRNIYLEHTPTVPGFRGVGVRPIVADPFDVAHNDAAMHGGAPMREMRAAVPGASLTVEEVLKYEGVVGDSKGLSLFSFEPEFLRPPPPLFVGAEDEAIWLNPESKSDLMWDLTMCEDTSRGAEIRELMGKAFKGPLVPTQQQQVLSELEAEPKLVYQCGLTPQRLPELVENNPMVAIECLLKLMSSSQITGTSCVRTCAR